MRLIKEVCDVRDLNDIESIGYLKEFDENGNLVFHWEYDTYEGISKEYIFSESNRILKEKIFINKSYGEPSEEREKIYEYNHSGYRILEYQTKIIHDSSTAPQFAKGGLITIEEYEAEYPIETNNLISIEDVKTDEGKVKRRKIFNLINNETEEIEYKYHNDLVILETTFELYKLEKKITKEINRKFNEHNKILFEQVVEYIGSEKKIIEQLRFEYPQIKSAFSKTKEIVITTDLKGNKEVNHYDFEGNIRQRITQYDERIVFINNYNNNDILQSITEVKIEEDSHDLLSTTKFYYQE